MAESVHRNFPSQVVSDFEKASYEYGLKVAKAIEAEWLDKTTSNKLELIETTFTTLGSTLEVNKQYKNIKMSYLLMVTCLI